MATLKVIRKRILSVRNTQKITKAMKMVAAAKLRRAQGALTQARPHAALLKASVSRLVAAAEAWDHPLLKEVDEPQKAELWVLTSDRGLCGGFNGNLLRKVNDFLSHEGKTYAEVKLSTIGRKGRDYYRAKNIELHQAMNSVSESFDFAQAMEMAQNCVQRFQAGEFDVFYLAYNSFKSAISQVPCIVRVLPLSIEGFEKEAVVPTYYWEGSAAYLLDKILLRYVATVFFLAFRESAASELGARMSAMENATNNAREMIFSLTLQYNRARQASITKELMDIVNGAEALK